MPHHQPGQLHFLGKKCPSCHKAGGIYFSWGEARYRCQKCEAIIVNPYTGKMIPKPKVIPEQEPEIDQNWLDFFKYIYEKEGKEC